MVEGRNTQEDGDVLTVCEVSERNKKEVKGRSREC